MTGLLWFEDKANFMQRIEQTLFAEIDSGRCILQASTITIQCIASAVIKNN